MKQTTFQLPEIRDANDNIIQQGTYGKESPLVNSTNDGVLDYINNNLMYLYNNTMGGTGGEINTETITGKTGTITNLTATTVKAGTLTADTLNGPLAGDVTGNVTGDVTGNLTGNVTGTADKAVADGKGNNIVNTYVTKSGLASSVTTATGKVTTLTATDGTLTNVTITGETSVPTANAGNSSKAIANTEFVQGELTNYLPLSGGTLTGVVNGVTPPNGDNSKKLATTEFVNANAIQADWNVTDTTSKAFIKNKPEVYQASKTLTINDTRTENPSPGNYISKFPRRIMAEFKQEAPDKTNFYSVLNVIPWDNETGGYPSQLSFTTGGRLFYRIGSDKLTWGPWHQIAFSVVGAVVAFAGRTTPQGWLLCDGSAVSRTTYAKLFSVIGTTYGSGNGSTTFNLPNLVDEFVEGSATAGTVKNAGLPNITGSYIIELYNPSNVSQGAYNIAPSPNTQRVNNIGSTMGWATVNFDASRSNAIYGNSDTVQPPAVTMRYIIKY